MEQKEITALVHIFMVPTHKKNKVARLVKELGEKGMIEKCYVWTLSSGVMIRIHFKNTVGIYLFGKSNL